MDGFDSTNNSDQFLDWFGDQFSLDPSSFCLDDDLYNVGDLSCNFNDYLSLELDPIHVDDLPFVQNSADSFNSTITTTTTDSSNLAFLPNLSPSPPSDVSKKRKTVEEPVTITVQTQKGQSLNRRGSEGKAADQEVVSVKKQNGAKRKPGKSNGSSNLNNGKDGRWAEQLLNPCAAAIMAGNVARVQHLLLVLRELGSATGDANYRLAVHGLKALTHHICPNPSASGISSFSFASSEPKFFQNSLFKFYEVSPWFIFPNTIANFSILQILAQHKNSSRNLHILDIGVSHGIQYPTLLEALSKQPGGPPPLVRLTVMATTSESDQNMETPFSVGPPGHKSSTRLLSFAKVININLQINYLNNYPLQNLNSQAIDSSENENLVVCAQFRLHNLNHKATTDERAEFLRLLRNLNPKGVILTENNMDCSCSNCGDFATGFARRVDYLWKFLDSTSSAFKGRHCDERQVLEGEAAKALINNGEMNEGKEKWCERMRDAGFAGVVLDEDVVDAGKALLKKYDGNWEMRVGDKDGCVGLWWKGQPVSFCSLWKPNAELK